MPKTINKRSATGLFCVSSQLRTGHIIKIAEMCCSKTLSEHINLFTEQMQHINDKFFAPFVENPLNIDPTTSYNDILSFFDKQRQIYANNNDVMVQINFISEAMKIIRTDATQYYLRSVQNEALAREIETSIEGLLLHIYLLNSRISILSKYCGDNAISGAADVTLTEIEDTRRIMARTQPELYMINFLFPDQPTFRYYNKLKRLMAQSGLYPDKQSITDDLKRFLDRFVIKYDLGKTLEQYLEEINKNNDNNEIINDDILEIDEYNKDVLKEWREKYGDTVLSGSLCIELADINKNLKPEYYKSNKRIENFYDKPDTCNTSCKPSTGIVPYMFEGMGRMIPLDGCFNLSMPNIDLNISNIENVLKEQNAWARTVERLFVRQSPVIEIKEHDCVQEIKKNKCNSENKLVDDEDPPITSVSIPENYEKCNNRK